MPNGLPEWLLRGWVARTMPPPRASRLEEIALAAQRAGLRELPLPNFGATLTADELSLVNSLYDEARNWSAGSKATTKAR